MARPLQIRPAEAGISHAGRTSSGFTIMPQAQSPKRQLDHINNTFIDLSSKRASACPSDRFAAACRNAYSDHNQNSGDNGQGALGNHKNSLSCFRSECNPATCSG